jgi:hypothetical protein
MARILKRPMFRRGGMPSNEGVAAVRPKYMGGGMSGIMTGINPTAGLTPRMGYAKGPSLEEIMAGKQLQQRGNTIFTEDYIKDQFDKLKNKIYTGGMSETDLDLGLQVPTNIDVEDQSILDFIKTQPEEAYKAFKTGKLPGSRKDFSEAQKKQAKEAKAAGIDIGLGDVGKKIDDDSIVIPSGEPTETTKSEFERIFGEYLPVIQDQLKPDEDSAVRDRYLALAKFGTSLMGQPGGDLAGAVGKASQQPLTDLSKIAAQERKDKQTPKLLALQAALDRMKQSGTSNTDKQISYQQLDETAKGISKDGQVGYAEAMDIAEAKNKLGSEGGKYNSLYPDTKEKVDKVKGPKYYYTKEGTLKVIKDGYTFTPEQWAKEPKEK